jgi:D-lactate dehydrogenase
LQQYSDFIDDVVRLVVEKFDGALKDEHGTRRNMAPFIEVECVWGVITGFSISGVILTVGSV